MDPVAIVADVTEMETRPPTYPEHVAALEELGFRVLGRFATLSTPSRLEKNVYPRSERARLDDWRLRPAATVLVAPDGSAFAGVDTFGEAAMLRLRTELDDASIVETVGVQQEGAIRPRRGDPFASMTSAATEDHSIRLVRDPSPAVVTAEHRYHVLAVVTERGAQPVRHSDRDQALRLATRAVDHVSRVQARIQSMLRWVVVGLVIPLGLLLLWWELGSDMSVTSALLLDMLLFAAVVLVLMPVMVVLSRWHGWRPPLLTKR